MKAATHNLVAAFSILTKKTIMKKLILTGILALTSLNIFASSELKLDIVRGVRDTLHTDQSTIICVTSPGAQARVNGIESKVYKTGSFEAPINLLPGANKVSIEVKLGTQELSKEINIVRIDAPKPKKSEASATSDATMMYTDALYVKTTDGAYLQYGNGSDRLGGSKMGFIDTDITLKAIGEKGNLYCVRLASDRIAYIPKSYTKPSEYAGVAINTGGWSISNNGRCDRVAISLPRRLPYQYTTELNPNTISIDIFGATDNSNWITQRSLELGIIDHYDFRQVSEDVYRVILHLKNPLQWGYQVSYEGNNLIIDVRHAPKSLKLKDLVIGLDAGHGGSSPGAYSPSGLREKDVNLDIVMRVDRLLRSEGARTVLTRDSDIALSMAERKRIWADAMVDLAVSVHNNAAESPSVDGTAVLYKHLFCRPFSLCMTKRLVETGLNLFGLVQNFNFSLNAPTLYPECLVEGMFMSNLADEERLADPDFRQLVAEKIVAGIKDYLRQAGELERKASR